MTAFFETLTPFGSIIPLTELSAAEIVVAETLVGAVINNAPAVTTTRLDTNKLLLILIIISSFLSYFKPTSTLAFTVH